MLLLILSTLMGSTMVSHPPISIQSVKPCSASPKLQSPVCGWISRMDFASSPHSVTQHGGFMRERPRHLEVPGIFSLTSILRAHSCPARRLEWVDVPNGGRSWVPPVTSTHWMSQKTIPLELREQVCVCVCRCVCAFGTRASN